MIGRDKEGKRKRDEESSGTVATPGALIQRANECSVGDTFVSWKDTIVEGNLINFIYLSQLESLVSR